MAKSEKKSSLLAPLASGILAGYIKLVYKTSRKVCEPAHYGKFAKEHHPFIGAMWHGQFLLGPITKPTNITTAIMVAKHGDGDIIGGAIEHFGMKLIRGGGAGQRKRDRGGMRALRESLRILKSGTTIGMTADVPPGPARIVGLGIVTIARMSGRPILPTATATSRFHAFNTWSRMTLNLPFSKLAVVYGDPIYVPRETTEDELETYRQLVEDRMNEVTTRAYELVGRSTDDIRPYTLSPSATTSNAPRPPIGIPLKIYRTMTNILSFTAPWILRKREQLHKEDPARRNERLGRPTTPRPQGTLIWFHAASVGETNAILPILPELRKERPDAQILLTTGTLTSARLVEARAAGIAIHQFIPLDVQKFMKRFIEHWKPNLAVIAESEIWPNLILESSNAKIPLLLINARMSKKSFRAWKKYGVISRPLFGRLDLVLSQTPRITDWYKFLGSTDVHTTGNLKVDAPPPPVDLDKQLILQQAIGDRPLFLAVSTHPGEDMIIADAHRKMARKIPGLLTILAPRHPERGISISEELRESGLRTALRSQNELPKARHDIYIADTIGELGTLYSLSPVAFIGGSLVKHGGQNPLEAIKLDTAVLTGPYHQNFIDIYQSLFRARGAIEVTSAEEIAEIATNLLQNGTEINEIRLNARKGLAVLTGALSETVNAIVEHLPIEKD